MIKIKAGLLTAPDFMSGCQKIHACPTLDGLTAYAAAKLIRALNDELAVVREGFKKLAHEYGEVNAEGGLTPVEEFPHFKLKEGMSADEYKKKVEEYASVDVEVERPKLTLQSIASVKLSPREMEAIEPIIHA